MAGRLPDEAFTYDPVGSRLTSHLSLLHRYELAGTNRLLEDDTFTYAYDANGNLTAKTTKTPPLQTTTYTYDVENQLIRIALPDGRVASYRYDGLGRRIEKSVTGIPATRFLYDQEDILALFDPAGCWQQTIVHGPGLDQPLAFGRDSNADCTPASPVAA